MSEELFSASVRMWPHVLACARAKLSALVCVTELIDNSLDWEATSVDVEVTQGKSLVVRDNGRGIEDMRSLVTWGGHVENLRKRGSGIYGVGLKDAALVQGGEHGTVHIDSTREGVRRRGLINWQLLKTSDACLKVESLPTDEPSGTEITIRPLKPRFPEGSARQKLVDDLGYIYSPALKKGARIVLRAGGATVDLAKFRWRLPQPPDLLDVIDERITIGRKSARVYAGIVRDGVENPRPGLSYMHGYRVVKASSREGCGTHSHQRICGFVEIDAEHGWERTRNKDDLVCAEDLYEAVEALLTPILLKADVAAHHLQTDEGLAAIECALSEVLDEPVERGKRKKTGEKPGTVDPKNTGKKHEKAENTQPDGHIRPKSPNRCLSLTLAPGWKEGEPWGTYEITTKLRSVTLYDDHPLIRQAKDPWDATVIFVAALTLVHHKRPIDKRGQVEMLSPEEMLVRLATATSKLHARLDGAPLAKAAE